MCYGTKIIERFVKRVRQRRSIKCDFDPETRFEVLLQQKKGSSPRE